jgi:phage protein D
VPALSYLLTIDSSPADSDLLDALQEVHVDASLHAASSFRLKLAIHQTDSGDWTVLEDDVFQPLLPVGVRVQVGSGAPEALINGYVTGQAVTYADRPGETVLEVSGLDATLLMNLEEKVTAWANQSDSAIATAIFTQNDVVPDVESTSPVLSDPEGTTIQRSTDIRFLRRLAQRNGFDCYVQPEPTSGADVGHFKPPQLGGDAELVLSVNVGSASNVAGFAIRYEMTRPTSATANALDVRAKSTQTATAQSMQLTALGSQAALDRLSPAPVVLPAQTGLVQSGDLTTFAQAVVDSSSWALVAEGELAPGSPPLRPGSIVNVRGAGDLHDGSYYVTRVLHTLTRSTYSQRFEARRNAVEATGAEDYSS